MRSSSPLCLFRASPDADGFPAFLIGWGVTALAGSCGKKAASFNFGRGIDMHGNLPPSSLSAIIPADQSGADSAQTGSEFFASACKTIFGKDAGLALSLATGVPERSCYRYASGEREVPVMVLRAILHSRQGEPFLAALMDGCSAAWWAELQLHRRMGRAAHEAE